MFDLSGGESSSDEENTEAGEEIGPLVSSSSRPSVTSLPGFDGGDIITDPALHTPKMRSVWIFPYSYNIVLSFIENLILLIDN